MLWVGIDGDLEPLNRLHGAIEKGMALMGFEADNRPYSPHLTLARVRDNASPGGRRRAARVLSELELPYEASIEGDSVSLMRTTFTPDGAIHDAIYTAPLVSDGG